MEHARTFTFLLSEVRMVISIAFSSTSEPTIRTLPLIYLCMRSAFTKGAGGTAAVVMISVVLCRLNENDSVYVLGNEIQHMIICTLHYTHVSGWLGQDVVECCSAAETPARHACHLRIRVKVITQNKKKTDSLLYCLYYETTHHLHYFRSVNNKLKISQSCCLLKQAKGCQFVWCRTGQLASRYQCDRRMH